MYTNVRHFGKEAVLLIEIIKRTPIWVFVLFFTLLILGYLQTKDREVKLRTVFILPISMIVLSVFGVSSAFGAIPVALVAWLLGSVVSLSVALKLAFPKGVSYSNTEKKLSIPGSWIPLFLMMAIFFTKYFVGVVVAQQLPIISEIEFIVLVSILYGCFSGMFLSRSIVMWQARNVIA